MPQFDNSEFNSPLDNLSSELSKQEKQGTAFKIAFFTLFTIGLVVVVWQVIKKSGKKIKHDSDKNTESN